jgi:hypothetical protein
LPGLFISRPPAPNQTLSDVTDVNTDAELDSLAEIKRQARQRKVISRRVEQRI